MYPHQPGTPKTVNNAFEFSLWSHDTEQFCVKGFRDVLSQAELMTVNPMLMFFVRWHYDGDFDVNLRTFLSLLPLGGVTFLRLRADYDLSPEFWKVSFGWIPTLQSAFLETDTSAFWGGFSPEGEGHEKADCKVGIHPNETFQNSGERS